MDLLRALFNINIPDRLDAFEYEDINNFLIHKSLVCPLAFLFNRPIFSPRKISLHHAKLNYIYCNEAAFTKCVSLSILRVTRQSWIYSKKERD